MGGMYALHFNFFSRTPESSLLAALRTKARRSVEERECIDWSSWHDYPGRHTVWDDHGRITHDHLRMSVESTLWIDIWSTAMGMVKMRESADVEMQLLSYFTSVRSLHILAISRLARQVYPADDRSPCTGLYSKLQGVHEQFKSRNLDYKNVKPRSSLVQIQKKNHLEYIQEYVCWKINL